ncbi:hypothetical protein [Bradyrhizobium japonicum]|uniref:hypothetical protein n=1 Tax=Bradyrhizobium japonicum TaxID=375 RepID=UPI001B8A13F9|nr:hypothetical protein [Bradyrhizobium japonicum]MBR0970332.1 hypothetical protein [Bradyrhizobium japonicum]
MKRIFTFLIFGPLLLGGVIEFMFGSTSALGWLVGLPFLSVLVTFPSAVVDYFLEGRRWQLALVTASGVVGSSLAGLSSQSHLLLTAIAGGISMAFCSWMTNQSWSPEHRA